ARSRWSALLCSISCHLVGYHILIVTVLSPDIDKGPVIPNLKYIYIDGVYDEIRESFEYESMINESAYGMMKKSIDWTEYSGVKSFESKGIQEFLKSSSTEKFDLIITEAGWNECFLGFIPKFGYPPVVAVSAYGIVPTTAMAMGTSINPSFVPNMVMQFSGDNSFLSRLKNFLCHSIYNYIYFTQGIPRFEEIAKKYLKQDMPSFVEIQRNFSIFLANTAFGFDDSIPVSPNIIPVGGMHIKSKADPLPKDLQKFFDEAKDGFIFFSLGTNLRSDALPKEKRRAILDAFSELRQRVLWKFESDNLEGVPPNVMIRKWLPQSDILAHPNIRMFISHCGKMSSLESIFRGVPVVGIPFFIDQNLNIAKLISKGVAVKLDYTTLNKQNVLTAVQEILNNSRWSDGTVLRKRRTEQFWLVILMVVFSGMETTEGAKILALFNVASPSHFIFSNSLARALAARGHQVKQVTPNIDKGPVNPNLKYIHIDGVYEEINETFNYDEYFHGWIVDDINMLIDSISYSCEKSFQSKNVQEFLKSSSSEKFDLIITEAAFGECFLGLIPKFGSPPVVAVSAFGIVSPTAIMMGTPINPSFVTSMTLEFSADNNFLHRFQNFLYHIVYNYLYFTRGLPMWEDIAKKYLKQDMPSFAEIQRNYSVFLVNTVFGFDETLPVSPNIIPVGGMHIKTKPDPLPKDLKIFLDEAKDGFIFFSLGSNLQSDALPKGKIRALLEAFSELPQRVLWKFESDHLEGLPPNVKIGKWLPQSDILAHPNIRMFMSHCGKMSSIESIFRGVPIVGIPCFGDQYLNMANLISKGIAVKLDHTTMHKQSILAAVQEILNNSSYQQNMNKLSAIYREHSVSPLERAVFWTEYVIKHQGALHLRPASTALYCWRTVLPTTMKLLHLSWLIFLMAVFSGMETTEGAKILALFNVASPSHFIFSKSLARALAARGHQVTVLSPDVDKGPAIPNLKYILIDGVYDEIREAFDYEESFHGGVVNDVNMMLDWVSYSCEKCFQSKNIQEFLKSSSSEKFDLIITEAAFGECFLGLIPKFGNPPVVAVSAFGIVPPTAIMMGTPINPSFVTNMLLEFSGDNNFLRRFQNFLYHSVYNYLYFTRGLPTWEDIAKKYLKQDMPSFAEIQQNYSVFLVNTVFGFDETLPVAPNIIPVGGMHIKTKPDPLPKDLQIFLDGAKDGFIFFSLGSNLHSDALPKEKIRALLDAFSELPQRVLWKFESDNLEGLPPNVKIGKWLPQSDILAHPNIRMFMSHCGKMSSIESIFRGVPIVGIPFFADQHFNIANLISKGIAIKLDHSTMNKQSILTAVQEILNNSSYRVNMKKLSAIYKDHPISALDSAIFWTEYVIKHGGAAHLRPASTDLYWYQFLLFDVILALVAGALIVVFILYFLFKKVYSVFAKKSTGKKKTN
ncbi:hypothetical protein L9F63_023367, partial [Diploptera punctata]